MSAWLVARLRLDLDLLALVASTPALARPGTAGGRRVCVEVKEGCVCCRSSSSLRCLNWPHPPVDFQICRSCGLTGAMGPVRARSIDEER